MQNSQHNHKDDGASFRPESFEAKWQTKWETDKIFAPNLEESKRPYYNLMMFPYPSAEGLHVGNMYAQTGADVFGRFQRMQGYDVFEPMGLDGFGIHSENYALKIGKNPIEQARISQERFYKQMKTIGTSVDWSRTLETYDPLYYRWTQWLFVTLFKAGLAYRKKAEVNWCPSCMTVLSDEQVIPARNATHSVAGGDGTCERCGTVVEKRELEQWFFKITEYAERLLQNIETLDWTQKVKVAQKNWIGKSTGAVINFNTIDLDQRINVFTTRPDTLYGATFLVVAPEHPLVRSISAPDVSEYVKIAKKRSVVERTDDTREKTGVFSGLYAINPVNNKKIPVWIADYVLSGYGTGAIMAVPAHDQRDYEFAKKYNLDIIEVISGGDISSQAYSGEGVLINSGKWDGKSVPDQMSEIIDDLEREGIGLAQAQYHLRDWLISRQRYWGPPIPMLHCDSCEAAGRGERKDMPGWHSVSLAELPVLLPNVADWKPMGTGKSPLANHPEFYETICPECGGEAIRETDVSDTFLDSAWYFLGYISDSITGENKESISKSIKMDHENIMPWSKTISRKWLPVTKYIGGAEHSVLHLLYSRFISMVLHDLKLVDFEEPFQSFYAHGLIIKDGVKMSKSKGNVVVPDEYIQKYGADTLRTYLMFLGPFSEGGDFRDSGIEGMHRFIKRVWNLAVNKVGEVEMSGSGYAAMHKTIKKVTEDLQAFKYNTAISALMEWYNFLSAHEVVHKDEIAVFLKLLAPFAPFMTEELWNEKGFRVQGKAYSSIHLEEWPVFDETYLVSSDVIIVIQVNGKRRGELPIQKSDLENKEKLESQAQEIISSYVGDAAVKKVIHVPGKIINFVI